ncbi:MAG: ATP-binding protein [Erysipelotrichaceae bacterium]|nr:ATP-binding protein [Erysipelotrichaceae bacterium]
MEKLTFEKTASDSTFVSELKKNPDVLELIRRENLSEKDIDRHALALLHYADVKKQCNKCRGLDECPFAEKGKYDDISAEDDFCQVVRSCRYLLAEKRKYAIKDNYLICDLGNQGLLYDLDKIDLASETAYYKSVVAMVRDWIENYPHKGFYFVGPLGTGKTFLAACISNHFARKGKKVAFVNMPQLCIDIKRNVLDEDFTDDLVRSMRRAEILVLDDIGAENFTSYIRDDILYPILDYRMENGRRTFFTSNIDLARLTERMSYNQNGQKDETKAMRLVERIRALAEVLPLKGESRRK